MVSISIIIVNYNGCEYTIQCIDSIQRTHRTKYYEIIVVDNGSTDSSVEILHKKFPNIVIVELQDNKGFGFANNRGAEKAKGEFLFFINNDTIFISEVDDILVEQYRTNQTLGIIAPKLCNEDGSFQLSFGKFPSLLGEYNTKRLSAKLKKNDCSKIEYAKQYSLPVTVDWVSGAAFMIQRNLFESIDGFDEKYFMYFEDSDLCRRIHDLKKDVLYFPLTSLIHLGGKSYVQKDERISLEYRKSQLLYYKKHLSLVQTVTLKMYLFLFVVFPKYFQIDKKIPMSQWLRILE